MRRNLFSSSFEWTSPCVSTGADCLVGYGKQRCAHKLVVFFATAGAAGGVGGLGSAFLRDITQHSQPKQKIVSANKYYHLCLNFRQKKYFTP